MKFHFPWLTLFLIVGQIGSASAAVQPGAKCPKADLVVQYKGKSYKCIRLGRQLYWDNGSKTLTNPNPNPNPITSTQGPIASPTAALPETTSQVTDLQAIWSGHEISLSFTFDFKSQQNKYISSFQVQVFDSSENSYFDVKNFSTSEFNSTGTTQALTLKTSDLALTGIKNRSLITKVRVQPFNIILATPGWSEVTVSGKYDSGLNAPVIATN